MSKSKVKDDPYESLRRKIDSFPIGAPRSEDFLKFLRRLYSEEEARILSNFNVPYMDTRTVEEFSKTTGIEETKVRQVFEDLYKRGRIAKNRSRRTGVEYYSLLPVIPGIFELFFADPRILEKEKAEVAKWIDHYYYDGWVNEIGASKYPFVRVIPVEKSFSSELQVLPYERVSEYIKNAERIAVMNCACRTERRKCDRPTEVCLTFDRFADVVIGSGVGRQIDKSEAEKILAMTEKRGLVHTTTNSQEGVSIICNCCTCCCVTLRALSEMKNPRAVAKSNYQPVIDYESCNKCRSCVRICPFKALTMHFPHKPDSSDEKLMFNSESCMGCGLCASACPNDAIKLGKVRDEIPEKTAKDGWMKVQSMRIH
jgi:electron transport complex protein RnfB